MIEVVFRAYAQKLIEEGSSPSIIILHVSIEVDINDGKSEERRRVKVRSDRCESLGRDEDKNGTVISMVTGLFLVRFSKLWGIN